MRNRIERLRIYLAGSAIVLLVVIAAFVVSARYLRQLRLRLPAKLGADVVRETDGYTYSQALKGKTVFEIHAAKAVEHSDGKTELHDVWVLLYGRNGDRHDRIYGDEFEYDKNNDLVRAKGLVHMDLQAATRRGGKPGPEASGAADAKTLHVTTSGLVYLVKLEVAATGEPIEFEAGRFKGHATGADYSSDSGLLMLHSAVSMSGTAGAKPVTLTAATATLDNRNQQAFLSDATYASTGRTLAARQATLHMRPDGTLARVEAQGDVTAVAGGATVVSQRGDFGLSSTSQLQSALLAGGVTYLLATPLQQRRGKADQAEIGFDAKGEADHAVFSGAVRMTERVRASAAEKERWSQRELTAAKVEVALAPGSADRPEVRDVEATGNAHLTIADEGRGKGIGGPVTTEVAAEDLKAHLLAAERQQMRLDTLTGSGHTLLRQIGADGMEQTSVGDELDARFRPTAIVQRDGEAKPAGQDVRAGAQASRLLASAVQQGHVAVTRRAPAKSGAGKEDVEGATAQRAVYDGDLDRVTLSGGVELRDAGSALWAAQVGLDHATGDARADGRVKAEFVQSSGGAEPGPEGAQQAEPAHVLADRAEFVHAGRTATFFGSPVRLWQEGSQIEAPVIEIEQNERRLDARGAGAAAGPSPAAVHTVLANAGGRPSGAGGASAIAGCAAKTGAGAGVAGANARAPEAMRIASGGLTYSSLSREADFTGGVYAQDDGGTIRANEAAAYLQGAGSSGGAIGAGPAKLPRASDPAADAGAAVGGLSGRIDRIVVSGAVTIDQPGMHASGARLVYTASDRVFLLSGDKGVTARASDAEGRSTTSAALRFQSCGAGGLQDIEALGSTPGIPGQRVLSESWIHDDKKAAKKK
jgi:lipopolysaccharide export system protein LptA